MAADQLTIDRSQDELNTIEVLRLTGPMTLATLFEFQTALREITGSKVLLDLSGVPYMDSAGLGALLSFHVSCGRHQRTYAVAGTSSRLKTMMEVAHVDTLLQLFETLQAAEQFLTK